MEGEGVESREKGAQDDISYFATVSNRVVCRGERLRTERRNDRRTWHMATQTTDSYDL